MPSPAANRLNEGEQVTDSTLTAIMGRKRRTRGGVVEWDDMKNSEFAYGPELLYTDASKLAFGAFRTLKSPMHGDHDIFCEARASADDLNGPATK